MGISDLIPGISGGTMALCLGIYEKLIKIINNLTKHVKENLKFVIPLLIGIATAIILMSKVIKYSLDKYPLATVLFFIGLILGGLPVLYDKIKDHITEKGNIITMIITIAFVLALSLLSSGKVVTFDNMHLINYILLGVVGAVGSCTLVIPGISGSFVLLLLGYYKPIIGVVSDITTISHLGSNLAILIPFGIGFIIGILAIAKIIEFFFKNYEIKTYSAIVGFVLASIIGVFINIPMTFSINQFIVGIFLLIIGYFISMKVRG